jgi:cyclophilin family peptidyl-prolyl cis-trans isomerase
VTITKLSTLSITILKQLHLIVAIALSITCTSIANAQSGFSLQLPPEATVDPVVDEITELRQFYGRLPDDVDAEVRATFDAKVTKVRDGIKSVRRAITNYSFSGNDGPNDVRLARLFSPTIDQTNVAVNDWTNYMADLYASDPQKYADLGRSLYHSIQRDATRDSVDHLTKAARAIFENPPSALDPKFLNAIGYIGYATNDFDLARKAWDQYKKTSSLPAMYDAMYKNIDQAAAKWEVELQQRELDKSRNNPIVELLTTKSTIKIELFEDQAPNAVANFVYLIENAFYKRVKIFRVIPSFGAQTGCKIGNGTGNGGYYINSEADKPEHRSVFRGSVFFALSVDTKTMDRALDSASTQFLISSNPQPNSDAYTVFGRVIDEDQFKVGLFSKVDLSEKEQAEDKSLPVDYIIEAKVIQKRDHAYRPEVINGKLPF